MDICIIEKLKSFKYLGPLNNVGAAIEEAGIQLLINHFHYEMAVSEPNMKSDSIRLFVELVPSRCRPRMVLSKSDDIKLNNGS